MIIQWQYFFTACFRTVPPIVTRRATFCVWNRMLFIFKLGNTLTCHRKSGYARARWSYAYARTHTHQHILNCLPEPCRKSGQTGGSGGCKQLTLTAGMELETGWMYFLFPACYLFPSTFFQRDTVTRQQGDIWMSDIAQNAAIRSNQPCGRMIGEAIFHNSRAK